MYSIIAFLITLGEAALVLGSYALKSQTVFYNAVVYASPFSLVVNLFNSESILLYKNPFYIAALLFHLVKYFIFFRAQILDDTNPWRTIAIIIEALYLALGAYYMVNL